MKKDEIIKLYQAQRLYIFPSLVALASLILIILVIYPQTIKLITNQKVKGEIFNKSQFLEAKAQSLESYDPTDLNRQVNFAVGSYPTDRDFVSALALLQSLTLQSGFSITSMSLENASSKGQNAQSQSYNIKIDILGPSPLLPTLFSKIENSPRLMRVSSVELTSGKDSQGAAVSLTVEVLYSSAAGGLGSNDSPLPQLSQKDEEVIAKLAKLGPPVRSQQTTAQSVQLGPRGKANPFE